MRQLPIGMGSMQEVEDAMKRPDKATRRQWLGTHCAELTRILERPNMTGGDRRLYRARIWQDGELVVVTLYQRFNVPEGGVNLMITVVRAYHYFPSHAPTLNLSGKYAKDEIAAFLQLDLVDPTDIEWTDETGYIAVPSSVSDLIGRMNG